MTHISAARILWALALVSLAIPATPFLRAQGDEWDKHIKAGGMALDAGNRVKYIWFDPGGTTRDSVRDYAKAEKEFQAALALTTTFPAGDSRTARTLRGLASVYMEEGKFAEAEEWAKRAIASVEAAPVPNDPQLGEALAHLAAIYDYDSKPEQAAPFWNRSLAVLKKEGRVDPEFMSNLNFVAEVLRGLQVDAQILNYIVELRESTGASDSDLRGPLEQLARAEQGPYAEWDYTRVLEIDKRIYGPDDPKTDNDMQSLAKVYADEGKYAAALPLLQQSLDDMQKNRPANEAESGKEYGTIPIASLHKNKLAKDDIDPGLLPLNRELAEVCTRVGKYPEAEELYQQIVSADEADSARSKERYDMDLSDDLVALARLYRQEHRYDEAVSAIKRSETVDDEIANSKWGKEHVDAHNPSIWLWLSQIELGEIYREKGDTAAAEPLFVSSVVMVQSMKLASGHPVLAQLLDNYATLLRDEGKYAEAESFYKRSLDTWAKSRYPEHPDAAETLMNYAALLRKLDRAEEAEPMETRATAILAKAGAPNPVK